MPIVALAAAATSAIGGGIAKSQAAKHAASQQAEAANEASRIEQERTTAANKIQQDQYDRARQDITQNQATNVANYDPFLKTGTAANNQLGYSLGLGGTGNGEAGALAKPFTMADYQADPGYAFRLSEGQKALDRVTSAKGKYFSGGAVKGLTDYNQDSASQEYQSAYDRYTKNQSDLYSRLSGVAGNGMTAANNIATTGLNSQQLLNSAGQNYANQSGGNLTGLGAQEGENTIGAGNAHAAGTIGQGQAWVTGLNGLSTAISNYVGQGQGAGAAGAMSSMSDIRSKENIKKIGTENGFNIYEFNYKGNPQKWKGVMAQEVQKVRPDAVEKVNGMLRVFYGMIGVKMEAVCQ